MSSESIVKVVLFFMSIITAFYIGRYKDHLTNQTKKEALLEELNDKRTDLEIAITVISEVEYKKETYGPHLIEFIIFKSVYPEVYTLFSKHQRAYINSFLLSVKEVNSSIEEVSRKITTTTTKQTQLGKQLIYTLQIIDISLTLLTELNNNPKSMPKKTLKVSNKTLAIITELEKKFLN